MSRSVIIPTSVSSSVTGSAPMCSSRISRAASTTDADASIERGSSVIASRTLIAIVPPLVVVCDLGRCLAHCDNRLLGHAGDPAFDRPCDLGPFLGRHHQMGPASELEVVRLRWGLLVLLELLLRERGRDRVVLVG